MPNNRSTFDDSKKCRSTSSKLRGILKMLRSSVNVKSLLGHNVSMSVEYEFKNMKLKFQAGDLIGHSNCTTIPEMTTFVVSLALNRAWLRILEK